MGRFSAVLAVLGLMVAAGCDQSNTHPDRAAFDDGYSAFKNNQWQRAVDGFTKYLRSDPNGSQRGEVYYYRGEALVHLNRRPEAMADFGRALSTKVQQPILAYTYVAIGNLYYEEGNDDKAVAAYGEAIKGPQDDLPMDMLLLRLGTSLQRTGKWAAADKYLGPLIDRYPKSAAAIEARRRFKADSFTVQTGAYSTAAAAQTEAQKLRAAGFTPRISQTTRAVPQPSFTQPGQPTSSTQVLYTVQVGKARTYVEALGQAQMLTRAGFAALIVP